MGETVIKKDIVELISLETRLPKTVVEAVVNSFIDSVQNELSKGNRVRFAGFGSFDVCERAARTGRNPHTGKAVDIPSRVVPVFYAGERLKRTVSK